MEPKRRSNPPPVDGPPIVDPGRQEAVKDILHRLANTVSALKIFPPEHATAVHFIDNLAAGLEAFLAEHGKLEVGVEEYSFTVDGRTVFTDEMAIKSLPFFFFKDGLRILYLYQGLDRAEIVNFLDLIRTESQKPAGESDMVTAMWARDFANIQYFAPDEFLETRILEERSEFQARHSLPVLPAEFAHEVIDVKVDTSKFSTGKIILSDEDRGAVRKGPPPGAEEGAPAEGRSSAAGAVEDEEGLRGGSPAAVMDGSLTEGEVRNLEELLRASRTASAEEEFLDLVVEILFLEDDPAQDAVNLSLLEDYRAERVAQGDFASAVLLVHKIGELRDHVADSRPEKARLLGGFLGRTVGPRLLEAVRELLSSGRPVGVPALLDFLRLVGDASLPLAADVYESTEDPDAQRALTDVFREAAERDPRQVAGLAADERPRFSIAAIDLLASAGGRGLPFLSTFIGFKRRDIKLAAVDALGRSAGETANHILFGFLKDEDEDVRTQAAMGLDPVAERDRLRQLIREAGSRAFRGRSSKEKRALLEFLGRTRSREALAFLRSQLRRPSVRAASAATEMRVCAVSGLERMGTPEARAALEGGARSWNKTVREACSQALARLARASTAPPERRST